jgi:hypothetical protein
MEFYDRVPKEFTENLRYRRWLRERAERDPNFREAIIKACRSDVLFWLASSCWLHEPRPMKDSRGRVLPEVVPFIPWRHQEPIIRVLRQKLGFESVGLEKARGEGASWIAVYMALHDWIFALPGVRMVSIGIVSRNMDTADSPDDMASMGAKIDWALTKLPWWMVGEEGVDWKRFVTKHTWKNQRNGSVISAYAATGEVGSGGRYTWFLLDELSKFPPGDDKKALTSTQPSTNSRLIIGTPYGSEGAYYDVMHEPSSMTKLVLDWKDNPTRNRGLYRFVNGNPTAIDPIKNPLPENYGLQNQAVLDLFSRLRRKGFRLEKGIRSPWYDRQCDEPDSNPYSIAQEYDRDYGGSMYKIFGEEFFKEANANLRQPFCRVNIDYNEEHKPLVSRSADGLLQLWMTLDTKNKPPEHPYVVSADLCSGLGGAYTSNSVLEILDILTMEQVGELASNTIEPDDFADLTIAICNWLGDAYLAWERNGPGGGFTTRIRKIGYPNVYYQTRVFEKKQKKTRTPGWWTDQKTKEVLFMEAKRIVTVGELKLRSEALVKECHQYIRIGRTIEHVGKIRGNEGPDSGDGHGDRVIALGIGVQALHDRPVNLTGHDRPVEPGTIEERDRDYFSSLERPQDDWDDRTNWDLMRGRGSGFVA